MATAKPKAKMAPVPLAPAQPATVATVTRNRLKEPSTWAGVGTLIGSAAAAVATKDVGAIAATVASLLAIFMPERKGQ